MTPRPSRVTLSPFLPFFLEQGFPKQKRQSREAQNDLSAKTSRGAPNDFLDVYIYIYIVTLRIQSKFEFSYSHERQKREKIGLI